MAYDIQKFEEQHMAAFKFLATLTADEKKIKDQMQELKDFLAEEMEKHGITSIDNDILKITYISPSESIQLDTKKWRAEKPDEYNATLDIYNKKVERKGYVKFAVK